MRLIPDYDLNNPASWTVLRERDVWSESEAEEFQRGLVRIAGLNPHGQPNLIARWGVTYAHPDFFDGLPKYYLSSNNPVLIGHEFRDPQTGDMRQVKRLEDVPADVLITLPVYSTTHLGERRFIVEQHRTAEFLRRTGRFRQTWDTGDSIAYFACRNCGERVPHTPGTEGMDVERSCPLCGSKRVSPADIREQGEGRLMRDLPAEGCYDFFMRVEDESGRGIVPDARVLRAAEVQWQQQQRPFTAKDADVKTGRKAADESEKARVRQVYREAFSVENLMSNPEREEEFLCQQ